MWQRWSTLLHWANWKNWYCCPPQSKTLSQNKKNVIMMLKVMKKPKLFPKQNLLISSLTQYYNIWNSKLFSTLICMASTCFFLDIVPLSGQRSKFICSTCIFPNHNFRICSTMGTKLFLDRIFQYCENFYCICERYKISSLGVTLKHGTLEQ